MPMQVSQEIGFSYNIRGILYRKRRPGGRLLGFNLILSRFAGA